MGLDDELHRLFADDRLEVPVRTGAEWALVASARRRRRRQTALAAVGSAMALTALVGGGATQVARSPQEPVRPAAPVVVTPSSTQQRTHPHVVPTSPPPDRPSRIEQPGAPPEVPRGSSTHEIPSILRDSESSRPEPTTSSPSSSESSTSQSTSSAPSGDAD